MGKEPMIKLETVKPIKHVAQIEIQMEATMENQTTQQIMKIIPLVEQVELTREGIALIFQVEQLTIHVIFLCLML